MIYGHKEDTAPVEFFMRSHGLIIHPSFPLQTRKLDYRLQFAKSVFEKLTIYEDIRKIILLSIL